MLVFHPNCHVVLFTKVTSAHFKVDRMNPLGRKGRNPLGRKQEREKVIRRENAEKPWVPRHRRRD